MFDLIVGTSDGGLLALAIGKGYSGEDCIKMNNLSLKRFQKGPGWIRWKTVWRNSYAKTWKRFDFERNREWQEFFKSVEIPTLTQEVVDKLKMKWYKRHIDPNFDTTSSGPRQPNNNTTSSTPSPSATTMPQMDILEQQTIFAIHLVTLLAIIFSFFYYLFVILMVPITDWMYSIILCLFGIRSLLIINHSIKSYNYFADIQSFQQITFDKVKTIVMAYVSHHEFMNIIYWQLFSSCRSFVALIPVSLKCVTKLNESLTVIPNMWGFSHLKQILSSLYVRYIEPSKIDMNVYTAKLEVYLFGFVILQWLAGHGSIFFIPAYFFYLRKRYAKSQHIRVFVDEMMNSPIFQSLKSMLPR